jgi:hypothetical protein
VERVITSIKGQYKLVMVVGATEAWKKVVCNVVDGSVPMGSEFGAFEVGKVRNEDVIFVKWYTLQSSTTSGMMQNGSGR